MNRRRVMQIAGIGALAAAMPLPTANAAPPTSSYRFEDNFDGPAGSAPDYSKWEPAYAREDMEDPTFWELPGNVGQYRDDRRNLFLDGKSNLVIRAAKDGDTYYSGKLFGKYRGGINTTWEARIKLDCLTPGCWPAWYLANNSPVQRRRSRHHGVVRQRQLGSGNHRPRKTERRRARQPHHRAGQWVAHVASPVE